MTRLLRRAFGGLRALILRTSTEQELDAELRQFFDAAVEQKMHAGMSREDAVARARRELGNIEAVKDDVRRAGWESIVESSYQDLRYAIRTLRRTPGFPIVAIVSLALGIGANTAIFSILNSLRLKPLPVAEPARLVVIASADEEAIALSYRVWTGVRESQLLPQPAAWATDRVALTDTAALKDLDAMWATGDLFNVLGIRAALGRTFDANDDRRGGGADGPVAVISHALWQRQFGGSADAIGRRLMIERVPFTIIGVTPRRFFGLNVGTSVDVMLPLETEPLLERMPRRLSSPFFPWLQAMGRLGDGQTAESVGGGVAAAQARIRIETMPPYEKAEDRARYYRDPWVVKAAPRGISGLRGQYDAALVTLLAIVVLVLLVACTSIATLMSARSIARRHEFVIRRALGAARGRLFRQLLIESLLLSVVGAAIGVFLARWGSQALVAQLSTWFSTAFLDLSIDPRVLTMTVVTTVMTAVMCGTVPALRAARVRASDALTDQRRERVTGAASGIGGLMILQVALSLILVCGAGLFLRSLASLASRDLGFDRSRLLVGVVDVRRSSVALTARADLYERVRLAVATVPGVERVATSLATPMGSTGVRLTPDVAFPDNRAFAGQTFRILTTPISDGWFQTYGTQLRAGRDFNERDRAGTEDVAIVNDAFARRYFDGNSPIGHSLVEAVGPNDRRQLTIVGLVEDAAFTTVREPAAPTIYRPLAQRLDERLLKALPGMSLSIRTADGIPPATLGDSVARAVATVDPNLTVFNQTVTMQLRHLYMRERLLASVSGVFGVLGLLLAATGLYGVTAYAVRLRRREIGIRMALGADRQAIMKTFLWRVAWRVAAGIAIGTIASVWAARFVRTLLFGIDARDPLTFAIAAGVLATVALIAAAIPARRASRLEPTVVLREG
jgi:putative ABC transport system permease protein